MNATTNTLKSLTETTYDSVAGYRKAAETAKSVELRTVLAQQAEKRDSTFSMLNEELVRLGAEPVTSGTATGGLHRLWVDITSTFEKGDEAAAERVEEGEDYLAKKFEEALAVSDLDATTRTVIEIAFRDVKEGERLTDRLAKQYD